MKSDVYWSRRAAKRMVQYQKRADDTADVIAKAYLKATDTINAEIEKIFRAFRIHTGVTETEAKRLLRNVPGKNILQKLKRAAQKITDPEKRKKVLAVINSPAYARRIGKAERLQEDVDSEIKELADVEENVTKVHYADLAAEAYNRSLFDIQKGTGLQFSFAFMPTSRIHEILRQNWSGKHFSTRIWDRAADINAVLREELLVQFMSGRSYGATAKAIQTRMESGALEARRLVRTESAYIANSAEIESYKECGVKRFRFVATLDMRTSEACAAHDGKEYDVAAAEIGVNVPPLHPWCRSTTVAAFDNLPTEKMKRAARDPKTGKWYTVPADMTYEDWKKSIDERHGAGTWEAERKKAKKELQGRAQSGIMKPRGGITLKKGGILDFGALNPESAEDFERAEKHAFRFYEETRKRKTDVASIAKNIGWKEESIRKIKNHLFINKHDLGGEEKETFYPSYDIAVSWQNLTDGKNISEKDIILLKHEYLELTIMKVKNIPYAPAHKIAEEKHNYKKAVEKWRESHNE